MRVTTVLIRRYFAALSDPAGGRDLLGMLAPQAVVPDGERLRPCAEIDANAFAIAHRSRCEQGAGVLPVFSDPVALDAADQRTDCGIVSWFEVAEARARRRLVLALGVVSPDGAPQIGWCRVARRVEPCSYAQGLLQSLADYAWMLTSKPAPARTLLDASYFRNCWRSTEPLHTLPDARFSCRMTAVCCRNEFEIALAPEAQLLIDAVPWDSVEPQLIGTRLPVRADGKLQLKRAHEACRFLAADRRCLIHRAIGRQPFDVCAIFPYTFARTPDGVDVALSPVCPSARQSLGAQVQDCEEDLRERLALAQPRAATTFHLAPARPIAWPDFRSIEQALLDCLNAGDLPLRRRLYVGCRTLGAIGREPFDSPAWLVEPIQEILPELRAALHGILEKILRWDRPVLRSLPRVAPAELASLEARDAPVVTRILQNMLFSKSYSYQYDLTTAFNFAILLYLLTLVMQAAVPGPVPDSHWQELAALGVHGLLKDVLHEGVPETFRAALGTPEFGLWLLAA